MFCTRISVAYQTISHVSRPVLDEKPYIVVLFVLYLFFTTFGLFNIMAMALEQWWARSRTNRHEG